MQSDKITTPVGKTIDNLMGKNIQTPTLNDWFGRNHKEFQYHHTQSKVRKTCKTTDQISASGLIHTLAIPVEYIIFLQKFQYCF